MMVHATVKRCYDPRVMAEKRQLPVFQDFLQECNNMGVPENDFKLSFCDRCQNVQCKRSGPNQATNYANRVATWEERLFLSVPRKDPTTDPSVIPLATKEFRETNLTRWADPHSNPRVSAAVPRNFELNNLETGSRLTQDFARCNTPNPGPVTLPGKPVVVPPGGTFRFD